MCPCVNVVRPNSDSGAHGVQESGAVGGPALVTAEELEAIMKGGGQQPEQSVVNINIVNSETDLVFGVFESS